MLEASDDDLRRWTLWGYYGTTIASCLSSMASTFLLVSLCRLPIDRRKKLLARQLQHLAAADLFYAMTEVGYASLDFSVLAGWRGAWLGSVMKLDHFCYAVYDANMMAKMATLLVECHMALTFVAATNTGQRALQLLSVGLPFIWPLALVLALPSPYTAGVYWAASDELHDTSCDWEDVEWSAMFFTFTTLVTCFVCYLVSGCRLRTANDPAQQSVWIRAQSYLLVSCFVSVPMLCFNSYEWFFDQSDVFDVIGYNIAYTLYDLSGLFNFVVYALLSRHARILLAAPAPVTAGHEALAEFSFGANFRSYVSNGSTGSTGSSLLRRGQLQDDYWTEMFAGPEAARPARSSESAQ